jgi:1,4-alpha-glucan branching enzyme
LICIDEGRNAMKILKEVKYNVTRFTEHDIYLFREGSHYRLYEKLGAHIMESEGKQGVYFALWAPNAYSVSVIGDFNSWERNSHFLRPREDSSGIWEGFIPELGKGTLYKYYIRSNYNGYAVEKGDPFAFYWECPPKTASVVWDTDFTWNDSEWMKNRHAHNSLDAPYSIYEIHFGSWRRVPEEGNRSLTYREAAGYLVDHLKETGFTHIELLPLVEHPFYGSWGYQTVGYFAPTSRYGTPQDLMYLIDLLHQNGIGVIMDWVPSHFPGDEYGLAYFDGTHLYEHSDDRKGFHPEWKSYIFNYGRNEVKNFLISSALFWLDKYKLDGLRVDAVASMLYLDYARSDTEWLPNEYGGKENIDAIHFLRRLNEAVYRDYPDVQTIAEESTAWPMVSRPAYAGGLGFGMKWNMGWMHDTLEYFSQDPVFRKYHHNQLTFSIWYSFTENFLLPLSHDEVVHGKGALVGKMPGDEWQRYANLRLLYGYMFGHPGKKLMFMGAEFGQWREWVHEESLEWHVKDLGTHRGLKSWLSELNRLYRNEPAMHELDFSNDGFEWIDCNDYEDSTISFIRKGRSTEDIILVVCNLTPVPRYNSRMGVPRGGYWQEILNSDSEIYGGSNMGNAGGADAEFIPSHGREHSLLLTLPPLGALFFKNRV